MEIRLDIRKPNLVKLLSQGYPQNVWKWNESSLRDGSNCCGTEKREPETCTGVLGSLGSVMGTEYIL